jgi:hypothetical protein
MKVQKLYIAFALILCLLLLGFTVAALPEAHAVLPVQRTSDSSVVVHAAGRGNPWVNLKDGLDLPAVYNGAARLTQALEREQVQPLGLAAADFDEDGVPDLVSSYAAPTGGILALHRGNVDTIYPNSPTAQQRRLGGAFTDAPFLSPASTFELPVAPDFMGAGDLNGDGHQDVVIAVRGGELLYLLPGDGQGSFGPDEGIPLPGGVTAMAVGEINRRDGLEDVAVGVAGPAGPMVLVFEWPTGALRGEPEVIAVPAEATALALGQLDEHYAMDLAVAAGNELLIVHGRDRKLSLDATRRAQVRPAVVDAVSLPYAALDMALGDFCPEEGHQLELALLAEDGTLHLLDPATATEVTSAVPLGLGEDKGSAHSMHLVRARVSGLPTDDLVLVDPASHQVRIVVPVKKGAARNDKGVRVIVQDPWLVTLDVADAPVAVLPMRLNADALSDLVILKNGPNPLAVAPTAPMHIFTVNSTGDEGDAYGGDDLCDTANDPTADPPTPPSGICTLRAAIGQANASAGADTIAFNIGAGGAQTIVWPSYRYVDDAVTIDGTTQPGFSGTPLIELKAPEVSNGHGLSIRAGSSTVRGLVVNSYYYSGIMLQNNGGNIVEGNFVGTDVNGTAGLGNRWYGVHIDDNDNNTVGGTTPAARNVISGNDWEGIRIRGTGNSVLGNYIGTDANGTVALSNDYGGVTVLRTNNTVGGDLPAERNVISGNNGEGVYISGTSTQGNLVMGNLIGVDVSGTGKLENSEGVQISNSSENTIGGTTPQVANVISGNDGAGVLIDGSNAIGNQIQGNRIGTNEDGSADLGNFSDGIRIGNGASDNVIGGQIDGAGNTIAYNGSPGVDINASDCVSNSVWGNAIFSSFDLGIDLVPLGVTPNDVGDGDTGANNLQNFPVIAGVVVNGNTTISGTLNSTPNTTFRIEFFSNSECDSRFGHGEGETFLGFIEVTTDSEGNATFQASFAGTGKNVTATATDPEGNTSEFSECWLYTEVHQAYLPLVIRNYAP